jgi:uncharacterized membrane protein YidH (DUF202 family)
VVCTSCLPQTRPSTIRYVFRRDALQAVFHADTGCKTVGHLFTDQNIVLHTDEFLNTCKFFFFLSIFYVSRELWDMRFRERMLTRRASIIRPGAPTFYYPNILADSSSHPPKSSQESSHHKMATVTKNVEEDPQSPPPTPTLTPSTEAQHDPVYRYHPQAPSHSPFHQLPQRSGVLTSSPNVSHSVFMGTKRKQKRSPTKQVGTLPTTMTSRRRRSRFNPSLTLKNSGNTARDHLASERTFLAYVRTSLAMASAGVGVFHFFLCTSMPMTTCAWIALVQLFKVSEMSVTPGNDFRSIRKFAHPLGAATVLFGLIILLFGLFRDFSLVIIRFQLFGHRHGAIFYGAGSPSEGAFPCSPFFGRWSYVYPRRPDHRYVWCPFK